MINTKTILSAIFALAFLQGCVSTVSVSLPKIPIQRDQLITEPCIAQTVGYSKSFFQERFLMKSFGGQIAFGPLIGQAIWEETGSHENREKTRLESSEYERLLNDFDVTQFFFQSLDASKSFNAPLKFSLAKDEATASQITSIAQSRQDDASGTPLIFGKQDCIAMLKISYGLGAKFGGEQFGFRKVYRPFLLLVGKAIAPSDSRVIWQDSILVFGDRAYTGGEADVTNINQGELIHEFQTITTSMIGKLENSLNGLQEEDPPILGDLANSDLQF